jgi:uncharacterized RDD family membrane protein YckC
MEQWYYVVDGQQQGPVGADVLTGMITSGQLNPTTMVWRDGLPAWVAANTVLPVGGPTPASGYPQPAPPGPLGYEIAGNPYQQGNNGIPLSQDSTIFWLRVGGRLIDAIALWIVGKIITFPLTEFHLIRPPVFTPGRSMMPQLTQLFGPLAFVFVLSAVAHWLYFALFESSVYQATPGKMVCQLRVVNYNGQRITFGRATGRAFANMLNPYTCYLAYLTAAFTQKKQAIEDMIASTLVVRKNSIIG